MQKFMRKFNSRNVIINILCGGLGALIYKKLHKCKQKDIVNDKIIVGQKNRHNATTICQQFYAELARDPLRISYQGTVQNMITIIDRAEVFKYIIENKPDLRQEVVQIIQPVKQALTQYKHTFPGEERIDVLLGVINIIENVSTDYEYSDQQLSFSKTVDQLEQEIVDMRFR